MFGNKKGKEKDVIVSQKIADHPAWIRLEDQLAWYDRQSMYSQKCYKYLKGLQISIAVGIPLVAHVNVEGMKWITSGAGAVIAILEGVQHMNQYSTLWVTYRSTAEKLKHEKYLFLSAVGPYRGDSEEERLCLLAERVEEHVSTEHANWFKESRKSVNAKKKDEAML